MSNLIFNLSRAILVNWGNSSRTTLTIVSFDLIGCYFSDHSTGGLSKISHKKAANWVLQVAGIFQTIPSMALLGLFIPFMGIGTLPALTALVIYAIFPDFGKYNHSLERH